MPGVYAVAITNERLHARPFSWLAVIRYVGMTVSVAGLKGRLKQFDTTLRGRIEHGGADRVRFRYRDYDRLKPRLFVAAAVMRCDITDLSPRSLRCMGDVVKLEYTCLAEYHQQFGRLPQFNDKPRSPKFSKVHIP